MGAMFWAIGLIPATAVEKLFMASHVWTGSWSWVVRHWSIFISSPIDTVQFSQE
jgi:hypothetical protein